MDYTYSSRFPRREYNLYIIDSVELLYVQLNCAYYGHSKPIITKNTLILNTIRENKNEVLASGGYNIEVIRYIYLKIMMLVNNTTFSFIGIQPLLQTLIFSKLNIKHEKIATVTWQ